MTILELPPMNSRQRQNAQSPAVPDRDQPASPTAPARRGLLQFQLRRLIEEIVADPDLDPDMCASLFKCLAENPEHPDLALLQHLREVHDPADLPPYNAAREREQLLPAHP